MLGDDNADTTSTGKVTCLIIFQYCIPIGWQMSAKNGWCLWLSTIKRYKNHALDWGLRDFQIQ